MSIAARFRKATASAATARVALFVPALAAGLTVTSPAGAVEFGRALIGNTVQSRVQRGYEPIGVRAGSFMFFPSLDIRGEYTDNIYARTGDKVGDFIVGVRPGISGRSLWQRHSLRMNAYGNFGIYTDNPDENYQDAGLSADGAVDIAQNSRLSIRMGATRDHERRSSPDDARGVNPTIYYKFSPELTFDQRINRVALRLRASADYIDFNDAVTRAGTIVNQDDRDRLTWVIEGRAGYDVSRNVQLYVSGLTDRRVYDDRFDDDGYQRASNGFGVFGGIIVDLEGLISAEAYVGYRRQSFADARLPNVKGVAGGVNLIWAPTKLTTVTLSGERVVEETTLTGSTASLNTAFDLTVDHELRRNIIITLSGGYLNRSYEGIGRQDDTWRGTVAVQYLISRHFRLRAGYSYNTRGSNVPGTSYEANAVYVNLNANY